YLYRLLSTRPQDAVAVQLQGRQVQTSEAPAEVEQARTAFAEWAEQQEPGVTGLFAGYLALSQSYTSLVLDGPTGERNSYTLLPRVRVLCLAEDRRDLLVELAAAL